MPHDPRFRYLQHFPLNAEARFATFVANGWSLMVRCWRCDNERVLPGVELAAAWGESATVGSIYPKLKCRCGAGHPAVDTVEPVID